ncbi:MAG: hypothetical protein V4635_10670 [Bacteroidota bacterium]
MKKLISFLPLLFFACTSAPEAIAPAPEPPVQQTADTISAVNSIDTVALKKTEITKEKPAPILQKNPEPGQPREVRKPEKLTVKDSSTPVQNTVGLSKIKTAEDLRRDSIIMMRLRKTWK